MKQILLLIFLSLSLNTMAADFKLHSNSFTPNKPLQSLYTCDNQDISPALDWSGIPDKTKTFVLTLTDPDAPSGIFYHWILFNIPKDIRSFREGETDLPTGVQSAKNSWGIRGYKGPCPPQGSTHRYIFTLYALDKLLTLNEEVDGPTVVHQIQNHILSQTKLMTTYKH